MPVATGALKPKHLACRHCRRVWAYYDYVDAAGSRDYGYKATARRLDDDGPAASPTVK
jgi:hypothetical protein